MKRRVVFAATAIASFTAAAMSGCSQVDSLQQVSGTAINTVQIATGDVLTNNKVDILEFPVCVQSATDSTIECKGSTTQQQPITVSASASTANTFTLSPGGSPTPAPDGTLNMTMTVSVQGKQIYSGQVQAVIDNEEAGHR